MNIVNYIKSTLYELKMTSWPTRSEILVLSSFVFFTTIIMLLIIFGSDQFFLFIITWFYDNVKIG